MMRLAVAALCSAAVVLCADSPLGGYQTAAESKPNLAAARAAAAALPRLHSLVVSWKGQVRLEHYASGRRARGLANVKSVSKSIISALVGIAIERGLIKGVSTPVSTWFPTLLKDPDPRKRAITVEDLLTMRTGLESTSFDNYGTWVRSRNWVQFVLTRPVRTERGVDMEYSTGSTHLLSAILTRAAKVDTHQFAQEALFNPLGVSLARWPRDPQGIYFGGNEMLLTPRQMLAFGELYLNRGRRAGRQIVPAAWVDTSCVSRGRSRFNPDQGYGYGWWTRPFAGHDSCFAWGYGGQYVFVFRELDLVVVTTSAADASDERRDHRRMIFELLERTILPEIVAGARS
jgi:CubicO group peptidase (beta-lactamase class C family)